MSLNFILADAAPKTVSIGPGAPAQAGNAAVSTAVKATETVVVDPAAAARQEQPPQQAPCFANPIILMLGVRGVMFFFTVRSQKKQQQKRQQMHRQQQQTDQNPPPDNCCSSSAAEENCQAFQPRSRAAAMLQARSSTYNTGLPKRRSNASYISGCGLRAPTSKL